MRKETWLAKENGFEKKKKTQKSKVENCLQKIRFNYISNKLKLELHSIEYYISISCINIIFRWIVLYESMKIACNPTDVRRVRIEINCLDWDTNHIWNVEKCPVDVPSKQPKWHEKRPISLKQLLFHAYWNPFGSESPEIHWNPNPLATSHYSIHKRRTLRGKYAQFQVVLLEHSFAARFDCRIRSLFWKCRQQHSNSAVFRSES